MTHILCPILALFDFLLTARVPWQLGYGGKGSNQVKEGPGDDDAVVDVQEEHHRHRGHSDTYKKILSLIWNCFSSGSSAQGP